MATTALADRLDRLAERAATSPHDEGGRAWLAPVVQELELRAGAPLGGTGTDPVVVLQRRLDRARRLLLTAEHPARTQTVASGPQAGPTGPGEPAEAGPAEPTEPTGRRGRVPALVR